MHRHRRIVAAVIAILATASLVSGAVAAKRTGATLGVSFSTASFSSSSTISGSSVPYGTPYVVSGCGYDAANGGVTVVVRSPEATAWAGQIPVNGCISVSNFSTQSAGSYSVDAYQQLRNKSTLMASTSFTLK